MLILFEMYHPGFIRNFEGPIKRILEHGHELVLAFERPARLGEDRIVAEFCASYPNFSVRSLKKEPRTRRSEVAERIRTTGDCLRYLDPRFAGATALSTRAAKRAPPLARRLARSRLMRTVGARAASKAILRAAEWALPPSPEIEALIDDVRPDLVLVTPLVGLGSSQADIVKLARQRGIPCALGVASWDNLTNKGVLRAIPDRVLVWNETQREEAVTLHDVPAPDVSVCGAWSYDHWFTWEASRSREDFLAHVGLDPHRDYLLYVCSSPFIAPVETGFVKRWAAALRGSKHQVARDISLLVRPHPQNVEQWRNEHLSEFDNVVVWPRQGANPIDLDTRRDYFHSLLFSRGIIGINTSALIEAGIVGRPVFTIRDLEFAATQDGTLHFHHLTSVNGGLLHTADSLDEHADQLAASLTCPRGLAEKSRRFVAAFIRPHGVETSGTDRFVSAIEAMQGVGSRRPPIFGPAVLRPLFRLWTRNRFPRSLDKRGVAAGASERKKA